MAIQNYPIKDLPAYNVYGLKISNDATTPDEIITIGAGVCRDSNNIMDLRVGTANPNLEGSTVSAPLSVNITLNGAGGLDTGSVGASKVYAVYLIGDSRYYNDVAGLLSLASNSSPTMPFGYDSYRLIGYAVTDSSSDFLLMDIAGDGNDRWFVYDAPQATAVTAGNATTYTGVALTALVPPVEDTPVNIFSAFTPGAAGRGLFMQAFNAAGDQIVNLGQVTAVVLNNNDVILAQLNSAAPSIKYKVSNSGDAVNLKVAGFRYFI